MSIIILNLNNEYGVCEWRTTFLSQDVPQFQADCHRVSISDIKMSKPPKTPEEVSKFLKLKSIDNLFADTDSECEMTGKKMTTNDGYL